MMNEFIEQSRQDEARGLLPTGSIFFIMGGCALLAIDYKKLLKTINFYAKESAYWFLRVGRRSR